MSNAILYVYECTTMYRIVHDCVCNAPVYRESSIIVVRIFQISLDRHVLFDRRMRASESINNKNNGCIVCNFYTALFVFFF